MYKHPPHRSTKRFSFTVAEGVIDSEIGAGARSKSSYCSAGTHGLSKGLRTILPRRSGRITGHPRCIYPPDEAGHPRNSSGTVAPAGAVARSYISGTGWRRPGPTSERLCHLWGGNLHMRVQQSHLGSYLLPPRVHHSCHQTTEGADALLGKTTVDRLWTPVQRVRTPLQACTLRQGRQTLRAFPRL